MKDPFHFRKVLFLVEAHNRRAASLDELLRGVNTVPVGSISYHMHREFLAHKFALTGYANDFAYWAARVIGDELLAEKLANLNVFRYRSLEGVRAELARLIAEHLYAVPEAAAERAQRGREFYFQSARSIVMECNKSAHDLPTFAAALAVVPSSSIFYHLFETRYSSEHAGGERVNDFAAWIEHSLGLTELGASVAQIDPYMFSLDEARKRILHLVSESPACVESAAPRRQEAR
jgi:hypothetical protein